MATKQQVLDAKEALRQRLGTQDAEALFDLAEGMKKQKAPDDEIQAALKAKALEMFESVLATRVLPFVILAR